MAHRVDSPGKDEALIDAAVRFIGGVTPWFAQARFNFYLDEAREMVAADDARKEFIKLYGERKFAEGGLNDLTERIKEAQQRIDDATEADRKRFWK